MRRAGRVVAEMHAATRAAARPGVTTAELDRVAREVLARRGARSNFLGYHGFPAVICTSPVTSYQPNCARSECGPRATVVRSSKSKQPSGSDGPAAAFPVRGS